MPTLRKDLRSDLEKVVVKARDIAERAATAALQALAVDQKEPFPHLSPEDRSLRVRLRSHGRALGDKRDPVNKTQSLANLAHSVAYEHWHRMLFARFLIENDSLIEPEHRVALSMREVEDLAHETQEDVWDLAGEYAEQMLPQIFRSDDPALDLTLPVETRMKLEKLLADLPSQVFKADDSLGWVYQFWQTDAKEKANKAGDKIDASSISAVTQLFTEDYMVDFILHNSLGAWHAAKVLAANPTLANSAGSEEELRQACAIPGCDWNYLRFVKGEIETWSPAAGHYPGWPRMAAELTLLDPSMGSGHFLAAALPLLARLRMLEENLSPEDAIIAVLRDNLHGLELDPRCAQLAGFNLALAAWKFAPGLLVSGRSLPPLQLACCGQAPVGTREEWLQVLEGRGDTELRFFLGQLYDVFQQAPLLGSLIQPRRVLGGLFDPKRLDELFAVVDAALAESHPNLGDRYETGVVVQGIAKAVQLLSKTFILVITNVPYLARGKQTEKLRDFIEEKYPAGKADLATAFVLRCLNFCAKGGTAAFVTPQNWLFLKSYQKLREELLRSATWNWVARLGPRAFETITGEIVNVALFSLTRREPTAHHPLAGLDVAQRTTPTEKADALRNEQLYVVTQAAQLENPDARVALEQQAKCELIEEFATSNQGVPTSDSPLFVRFFWEQSMIPSSWEYHQGTNPERFLYGGMSYSLLFENGAGRLRQLGASQDRDRRRDFQGVNAWGKRGVSINLMSDLGTSIYLGTKFDNNVATLIPESSAHLLPLLCYTRSTDFVTAVRSIDQKLNVTNATLAKVPFDLGHWTTVAKDRYPNGLPEPYSPDPTQWLFKGRVDDSTEPLQVAVARLLGYRWPAETDPEKAGVEVFASDRAFWQGLAPNIDEDGIVCLTPLRGEPDAAARLIELLHLAWDLAQQHSYQLPANWRDDEIPAALRANEFPGAESWIDHLLSRAGARDVQTYLRDVFFEEHCKVFQNRPFIWHIWDGRPDGFHALVNYHQLAAPDGAGYKLLENLTYAYLGDWIRRQKDDVNNGVPGAEDRLVAAEILQQELKNILQGEADPQKHTGYDIFVRWKPLHQQAIGWNPDINDGVRLNIRPFLLAKDVKKKGAGILRHKPNVKWTKDRGKEPLRLPEDYPWFWGWDEKTVDFKATQTHDGNRWNDCHYTIATKQAARLRHQSTNA